MNRSQKKTHRRFDSIRKHAATAGPYRRRLFLEGLEPRLVLSASAAGLPVDLNQPAPQQAPLGDYVPGEILIGFEGDVASIFTARGRGAALAAAERLVGDLGLHDSQALMHVPGVGQRGPRLTTKWQLPPQANVSDVLSRLNGRPQIAYAEPNYIQRISAEPDDLTNYDLWGMSQIDAPAAWDTSTGNPAIVVGVIDTGVDYTHNDLAGNMWVNEGEIPNNGVDDDNNGYIDDIYGADFINNDGDPYDDNNHGSHVSGTIGAVGNNTNGVVGVNWDIQIMALKFLSAGGSGSTDDAVEALNYAISQRQRGVNIVLTSNSWGGGAFSQALKDAIDASAAENNWALAGQALLSASRTRATRDPIDWCSPIITAPTPLSGQKSAR